MWIISGFFNAKALQEIALFAPKLNSLHIIIGKTEATQRESQSITFAFCDPFDVRIKDFSRQLEELTTHQEALAFITNHNVKIYTLTSKNILIHSKLYLLHRAQDKATQAFAIIGSSNLTASGLGIYQDTSNKELNLLCDSRQDTAHALSYFQNLRDQCQDVSQEVAENLKSSLFYHAPVDILHKLISLLPDDLEPLEKTQEDKLAIAKEIFGLYDFQLIAARELYKRLKAYSIAFLGDPVGAGKTLSALGVISLYKRVVIIAPKNLKNQWQSYITIDSIPDSVPSSKAEFLRDLSYRVEILSYYEATHPNDEQKSKLLGADLVVLDESHNFRNGAPKGSIRANKTNEYTRLAQNISQDSALLCLSATIINNSLLDFANQIAIARDSLTIHNTSINPIDICHKAQKALNEQAPLPENYGYLTSLIFSRSSEEIMLELKKLNKDMPTPKIQREHLSSIPSNIDFSYERLLRILGLSSEVSQESKESKGIAFSIYDPYPYLPPDIRKEVKESHLENLGEYTTPKGFICMSLLKSLESSIDAFLQILEKIISYHEHYLRLDSIEQSSEEDKDEYGELDSSLLPTRLKNLADLDYLSYLPQSFKDTIQNDLSDLQKIKSAFATYDSSAHFAKCAKFKALCDFIDSIPNIRIQKLLIFTESIPTAKVITNALQDHYKDLEIATISGEDSANLFKSKKGRFSPKSQNYTLKENEKPIDILVATDALSEGQNLQDCANLINWDIAFNPVRSIQRIGRIHRIGSSHKQIHITHFFPDIDIDSYIKLEDRLGSKLQASQITTHTSNPFTTEQDRTKEEHFKKYRQLLEKELIAFENTTTTGLFSSPTNLLQSIAYELKSKQESLPDGLFSIVHIPYLKPNTIFAALESTKPSKKLYYTLYDTATHKSITPQEQKQNLSNLLPHIKATKIPTKDFSELERISQNYRDIEFLKVKFKALTEGLDNQIKATQMAQNSMSKSDSGLIPLEMTQFKLIAWLLINPDFSTLNPESSHSLYKGA